MHKGNVYRRVLPPALSPNIRGQGAPFGLYLTWEGIYGSPDTKLKFFRSRNVDITVDLAIGRIGWRGEAIVGGQSFGWGFEQLLQKGKLSVLWTCVVFDNFGGLSALSWEVPPGVENWPLGLDWRPGIPAKQKNIFPFFDVARIIPSPIPYKEE